MKVKKKCYYCYKEFNIFLARAKDGRGKLCSRRCTDAFKVKFGRVKNDNNPAWKGSNISYSGIHRWIRNNYEKLGKCERCGGVTKYSDNRSGTSWALKRDKHYSRNKNDYMELCVKCHSGYDWGKWTDDKGEKHPMYRVPEIHIVDI